MPRYFRGDVAAGAETVSHGWPDLDMTKPGDRFGDPIAGFRYSSSGLDHGLLLFSRSLARMPTTPERMSLPQA